MGLAGCGCKPDSVFAEAIPVISLPFSRRTGCDQPEVAPLMRDGRATLNFLFDLAPDGVCHAARLSAHPGGLLHHLFTLIPATACAIAATVCFLWHFPFPSIWQGASRFHTGTSCPVESGLSSPARQSGPERPNTAANHTRRTIHGLRLSCTFIQGNCAAEKRQRLFLAQRGQYKRRPQKRQVVSVSARRESLTM